MNQLWPLGQPGSGFVEGIVDQVLNETEEETGRCHASVRQLLHETGDRTAARAAAVRAWSERCEERASGLPPEYQRAFVAWYMARVDGWLDTPTPYQEN